MYVLCWVLILWMKCELWAGQSASSRSLRFLSYNVENLWDSRPNEEHYSYSECPAEFLKPYYKKSDVEFKIQNIVALIRETQSDVVCLNEVEINNFNHFIPDFFRKQLPDFKVVVPELDKRDMLRVRGVMVLSRYPILKTALFEHRRYRRKQLGARALAVRLDLPIEDKKFLDVFCIHWSSNLKRTKTELFQKHDESLQALLKISREWDKGESWQLAMGDWNEEVDEPTLQKLEENGWIRSELDSVSCSYWYKKRCKNFDHAFWFPGRQTYAKTILSFKNNSLLNGDFLPFRWQIYKPFMDTKIVHRQAGFSDHLPLLVSLTPIPHEPPTPETETCLNIRYRADLWSQFPTKTCLDIVWSTPPKVRQHRGAIILESGQEPPVLLQFDRKPSQYNDEFFRLFEPRLKKVRARLGWWNGQETLFISSENYVDLIY